MWNEDSPVEIGGFLVVDNLAMDQPSMGGTRMLPDIIHNLARGMTLKNAAADLPFWATQLLLKAGLRKTRMILRILRRSGERPLLKSLKLLSGEIWKNSLMVFAKMRIVCPLFQKKYGLGSRANRAFMQLAEPAIPFKKVPFTQNARIGILGKCSDMVKTQYQPLVIN